MFSTELINFLKSVSKISNSIILRSPETYGKSEVNDISFKFNVKDVGNEKDDFGDTEVGLFDLSGFLNVVCLFGEDSDDRDITIEDNCIKISNEESKATYIMTEPQLLTAFDVNPNQIEIVDSKLTVAEFVMHADDIKKIRSASTAFKELEYVEFKGEDCVEMSLTSSGKFNSTSNSFTIKKACEPSKNFDLMLSLETFTKLPIHDYNVSIKYNEERNDFRILLKSITVQGFKAQVSVKVL